MLSGEKKHVKNIFWGLDTEAKPAYDTSNPLQTVEEEEYPSKGAAKGVVKSETTTRGMAVNGLPRAVVKALLGRSRRRDPAPVIQAARMLVRENEPAICGELSGTAE